jgi:hypothetical protein
MPCKLITILRALLLAILSAPLLSAAAAETAFVPDQQALAIISSGQETMHFAISWSGGIKIGDLRLSFVATDTGGWKITARVTDYGLFRLVYPVDDTFVTHLSGPLLLPERYEVTQIERGKTVHRLTRYDQKGCKVVYQKQKQPPRSWQVSGPVYNEFSAFFITRALHLNPQARQFVPVFADNKRHLVPIVVQGKEQRNSLFGQVRTVKVRPKIRFKGLYDKDGDTVFWLTDDACRVPVEIRSKILIGSLTAELVEYSNPACPQHRRKQAASRP